jgi:two-component system CheB/CheR fusion protein
LRRPLREEARSLMAISLRTEAQRAGIVHRGLGTGGNNVQLKVFPIIVRGLNERILLISFEHSEREKETETAVEGYENASDFVLQRIKELENEVAVTREALQQTIEQLETSNEELQSVNEELQSTNEELQATNEEVETSNEELQSTNEELITVNEELQITATELSGRTGELTSVLQSTPLVILVADSALQITQATTSAAELFGIKQPIATPHISQLVLPDGYPALAPICNETLRLGETTEREFSSDGTRVVLNCTPYFDVHGKILGLTMVATQFPGLAREMELILNASSVHIINRKIDGQIIRISASSAAMLGLTREEAEGANLFEFLPPEIAAKVRADDEMILEGQREGVVDTVKMMSEGFNEPSYLALERHRSFDPMTMDPTIYMIASNVTDVIHAADQTRELLERFKHLQEVAEMGYWELDPFSHTVYWSPKVFALHGVPETEGAPGYETAVNFYHPDDLEMVQDCVADASKAGGEFTFEARIIQRGGTEIKIRSSGIAVTNGSGKVTKIVGAFAQV